MGTFTDIDWDALVIKFGECASELRKSVSGGGRSYLVSELVNKTGSDETTVKSMLDMVVDHGLLKRVQIWICPITKKCVLSEAPEPRDTECPECGKALEGQRPTEDTQYVIVTPPRRSIPAIITVHGMNTRGPWQEKLAQKLSSLHGRSIPMAVYKFGFVFSGVIFRRRQKKLTEKLITQLKLMSAELGDRPFGNRPDVIAHSFGTWLLHNALKSDDSLRVGHVILTGCVLPPDARWDDLGEQVGPVLNHYGAKDPWTRVAGYIIPGSGPSGRRGFNKQANVVQVCEPDFGHSDFFLEKNLDRVFDRVWKPFLTSPASDIASLDSAVFGPTHPVNEKKWTGIPPFFRAGVVRWLAILLLILVVPVAIVAGLPVVLFSLRLALPVALVLGLVTLLGKLRGWDR